MKLSQPYKVDIYKFKLTLIAVKFVLELSYLIGVAGRQQIGSEGSDASWLSLGPETSLSCVIDYTDERVRECFIGES